MKRIAPTGLLSVIALAAAAVGASSCRTTTPTSGVLDDGTALSTTAGAGSTDPDSMRIHDAVRAALVANHGSFENSTWFDTTGNLTGDWLMQSPPAAAWSSTAATLPQGTACNAGDANCDPDFKLVTCSDSSVCGSTGTCQPVLASVKKPGDKPVSMCVGAGDVIYDRIYSAMIKAGATIDIISLSPPDTRYMQAMENALVYLDYSGAHVDVRMLFGGEESTKPTTRSPAKYLKETWLADLVAKKSDFSLTLSCAWLSHLTAWNHSKIIAIDGQDAIVGSMNFWARVYLQPIPVFDMSIELTGPAATAATKFADTLWAQNFIDTGAVSLAGDAQPMMTHQGTSEPPAGASKIIGTGRLANLGDNSSDSAISALFASSTKTIRIAQQDLYRLLSQSGPYGEAELADAVLRGVDVQIIKSSVYSKTGYGMYTAAETYDFLGRAIEKRAGQYDQMRPKGTYLRAVCDHVHFAPLRFSPANPPDGKVPQHTKLIMVDDAAFYLGSQNLYPTSLQEFGYVVFDKTLAQQMVTNYWNLAWNQSSQDLLPCTPVDARN